MRHACFVFCLSGLLGLGRNGEGDGAAGENEGICGSFLAAGFSTGISARHQGYLGLPGERKTGGLQPFQGRGIHNSLGSLSQRLSTLIALRKPCFIADTMNLHISLLPIKHDSSGEGAAHNHHIMRRRFLPSRDAEAYSPLWWRKNHSVQG